MAGRKPEAALYAQWSLWWKVVIKGLVNETQNLALCVYKHYSDVIMSAMRLKSPASRLFAEPFVQAQIKENIKALRHWPLWGESTGDRWIPHQKAPVSRKMFPFDDFIISTAWVGVSEISGQHRNTLQWRHKSAQVSAMAADF